MTEMLTMIVDPVLSTDSSLIFSGLHSGGRFFMFMTVVALVYARAKTGSEKSPRTA